MLNSRYVLIGYLLNTYLLNEDSFYVIKSLRDTSAAFFYFLRDAEDSYFRKCLENGNFLPPLRAAVQLIQCEDNKEYEKGFRLFEFLVKKNQGFDEAIKFIMEKIKEEKTDERACSLFDCLLGNKNFQKPIVEKMIPFWLECLQSESLEVRFSGHSVFKKLFRVCSADQEVLACIKGMLDSDDIALRREGKSLFESILNEGLCSDKLDLVYRFAQPYLLRDNVLLGLDLYTILMNKDICVEKLVADVKQMNLFTGFEQFKQAGEKIQTAFISFWKSSADHEENFEAVLVVAVYAIKIARTASGIELLENFISEDTKVQGITKETIKDHLTKKLTPEELETQELKEFFAS